MTSSVLLSLSLSLSLEYLQHNITSAYSINRKDLQGSFRDSGKAIAYSVCYGIQRMLFGGVSQ